MSVHKPGIPPEALKSAHLLQSDEREKLSSKATVFHLPDCLGNSAASQEIPPEPRLSSSALFWKGKQPVASVSCRQGVGGEKLEGPTAVTRGGRDITHGALGHVTVSGMWWAGGIKGTLGSLAA